MQPIALGNLILHPIVEGDIDLLHKWLNAPHVAEWFDGAVSLEAVQRKYIEKIRSDWQQAFIVYQADIPFGYVQSYRASRAGPGWWPDVDEQTVGIDQFIGELSFLGCGMGTLMVREFSSWLLAQPTVSRVIADPDLNNEGAIRCYRKAGFVDVGLVDTPKGRALLMERRT